VVQVHVAHPGQDHYEPPEFSVLALVTSRSDSNGSARLAVGRRAASLFEQLIEPGESVAAAVFISVRVDAKCDRDVGMAEDHHRAFRVHAKPFNSDAVV
jgi:hypothetical protein